MAVLGRLVGCREVLEHWGVRGCWDVVVRTVGRQISKIIILEILVITKLVTA